MPIRIPAYYDFASTICYVTHRVSQRQAVDYAELGVELGWQPIDLARISGWSRGAEVDGDRRANALRVAAEFGVEVRMPRCWLDSRGAHAVALGLAGTAKEPAWRERVWTAIFEEGRDVGDPDELGRLSADIGVFADLGHAGLEAVEVATRAAHEAGITGVPTLDLGGWHLPGLQDERTTRLLLQRFVQRRAGREPEPDPEG